MDNTCLKANNLTVVLNLIINGLPSKQNIERLFRKLNMAVLNLIINGLPSKHQDIMEYYQQV